MKALAVVADRQISVGIVKVDQDLDPGGPGMLLGIAQCFLADSIEGDLRLSAKPPALLAASRISSATASPEMDFCFNRR